MLGQADRGRTQADIRRLTQRSGDENLGHDDRLVPHRVMLADPELVDPEFVGPDDQLQVLVARLSQRLGRIVKRHDEDTGPNLLELFRHHCPLLPFGSSPGVALAALCTVPLSYPLYWQAHALSSAL